MVQCNKWLNIVVSQFFDEILVVLNTNFIDFG